MTIQAAIDIIDTLKPNVIPYHQKIEWLNTLDGMIWREIITKHEGIQEECFKGYDQDTEFGVKLLAPEPYSDIYRHYMAAQIDITTRETNEYAKDMILFNNAWQTLCDYWTREYMPKSKVKELRF